MGRPVGCRYPATYDKIVEFLKEGDANTNEIFEHINSTMRHGCTMGRLTNILAKMPDFHVVGTARIRNDRSRYAVNVWRYVRWES